jgi:hypothetical protein
VSQPPPPAGWYEDPDDRRGLRYWDGADWTAHRQAAAPPPLTFPTPSATSGHAPPMASASGGRRASPTGKQLLRASLALFRENRRMLWLPVLSGVLTALTFLVVTGLVGIPLLWSHGHAAWDVLVVFPGLVAANFVAVFFNVALVFAANEQIEGREVDVARAMHLAWQRRRVVFTWALVSATVGMLIQAVEQRLGILGRVLGVLGGLAWAVATFMVIPVLAFEDLGPLGALKESSHLLRTTFGSIARGALRFGLLFGAWLLLALAVVVVGVVLAGSGAVVPGVVVAVAGVVGIFVVSMYVAAAGMYMRTILYRYATGKPLPDLGLDLSRTFVR